MPGDVQSFGPNVPGDGTAQTLCCVPLCVTLDGGDVYETVGGWLWKRKRRARCGVHAISTVFLLNDGKLVE